MFRSDRAKPGTRTLYWVKADGTGDVTRLTDSPENQAAGGWHPSGKFLVFGTNHVATTGWDLMILPMEGDGVRGWTPGKPTSPHRRVTYLRSFSPNAHWTAYSSDELRSTYDVYVRPFPGPGGPWRISTGGGSVPRWSATAHDLLFLSQGAIPLAELALTRAVTTSDKGRAVVSSALE